MRTWSLCYLSPSCQVLTCPAAFIDTRPIHRCYPPRSDLPLPAETDLRGSRSLAEAEGALRSPSRSDIQIALSLLDFLRHGDNDLGTGTACKDFEFIDTNCKEQEARKRRYEGGWLISVRNPEPSGTKSFDPRCSREGRVSRSSPYFPCFATSLSGACYEREECYQR